MTNTEIAKGISELLDQLNIARERIKVLEDGVWKIAYENAKYTTGEGHARAMWIARNLLENKD